jgi:branched-chain amino acid transport system substrate-binding protein
MLDDKIRIGFPVPISSHVRKEVEDQIRGAQLAVEEFNRQGGALGKCAELLIRDTTFSNELAGQLITELIEKDQTHFIAGALSASEMAVGAQVCGKLKHPYCGLSVGDSIVSKVLRSPYVFHEGPSTFGISDAIGRFAFSRLGTRVAVLRADHLFSEEVMRAIRSVSHALGAEIIAEEIHVSGETAYTEHLQRLAKTKPEVLLLVNFGFDQGRALKAYRDLGMHQEFRVICPIISQQQRMIFGPEVYEGVVGGAGFYWRMAEYFESTRAFNEKYLQRFQMGYPGTYVAYTYSAIRAFLSAISNAQSLQADDLVDSLMAMHYDYNRGWQFYRHLDHQSVQPIVILESKPAYEMEHEQDFFSIKQLYNYGGERAFHISFERD